MRVLHASMEAFPYVKVGGLSDVLGALPPALRRSGVDARLILPGFPPVLEGIHPKQEVRRFEGGLPGASAARLLSGETDRRVPLYIVDAPELYTRSRDPYADQGNSHFRAAALSRAAAEVARSGDGAGWAPEILHCHDWQTGLAPAYLAFSGTPVPTVMTIHNLAYQGLYSKDLLPALWLPWDAYRVDGMEFWGQLNFLKAGLVYATRLTTVSPAYAREIQSPEHGHGLDGLLRARSKHLRGILNGVDETVWNPASSPHLATRFDRDTLERKAANKAALQRELGLDEDAAAPLFGVVSRFNALKGLDLLLDNLPHLVGLGAQLAILGRGDAVLERGFGSAAIHFAGRVALAAAQDEALAHRIFAGADYVVVPSRIEPCGLTQLYAMRYGAPPIVRFTGGLADTVQDESTGEDATGFTFDHANGYALGHAISRAVHLYEGAHARFVRLQKNGMARNFGWDRRARDYVDLYEETLG
jgi:starch synthase